MTNVLMANPFSDLPCDMVVEILSKLPVKSLLRFKTVCKPWKHLFESPVFIDIHLHRRNPRLDALVRYKTLEPNEGLSQEEAHSSSSPPLRNTSIVGACNGIICLKNLPVKRLFLWKPSTREWSFIPDELDGICYGFCYLSRTQEYQIISFTSQRPNNKLDILILTLGNTKYLRSVKDVTVPGWITTWEKVTSGTIFAWLGSNVGNKHEILIYYDAVEERFSWMNMPPSPCPSLRSLSILNDSVIMFVRPMAKAESTFFDIWSLVDDVSKCKSWSKYRKIGPLETNTIMKPIGIGCYDRSILCSKSIDDDKNSGNLFYYNLQTDGVEDHNLNDPPTLEIVNYVESLVSIKSLGLDSTYY